MTMFNRTDKPSDTGTTDTSRPQTATPTPEPVRAQPVSQPVPSAMRPGTTGTQGVSLISRALKITGQLESTEDIRIDGEIEGDVRGVSVTVGNGARIKGTVHGDAVELAGTVDGRIEAKKVILTGTARMTGDVVHQDIKIESGAFIDGHLKPEYGKADSKPKPVSAPKPVEVKQSV
jgi:cytoskeletal protein CcmA (bactofilin family)